MERKKAEEKLSTCHIFNLNPDPMLTGMIVHLLKEGEYRTLRSKLSLAVYESFTHKSLQMINIAQSKSLYILGIVLVNFLGPVNQFCFVLK